MIKYSAKDSCRVIQCGYLKNKTRGVEELPSTETRVRIGFKQAASGKVQMDLTVEAPTVDEAGELLAGAIDKLRKKVAVEGLETTD